MSFIINSILNSLKGRDKEYVKKDTILEYFWIDNNGEFRSKTRILDIGKIGLLHHIPKWNFDGSSTDQIINDELNENNTEIVLVPCAFYKCPFRRNANYYSYIVLCDIYDIYGNPHPDNKRFNANKIFDKYLYNHPWYGYEQEYFIMDMNTNNPININNESYEKSFYCVNGYSDMFNNNMINETAKQGSFYCGNGAKNIIHRKFVDEHMEYCLYAGLKMYGTNAEVSPGQWEFQIGPLEGINSCDQLWVARFILSRLGEKYGFHINYHPKIFKNYNGSGCHTNFSTVETREKGGYDVIVNSMSNFEKNHKNHMKVYGKFNELRLTGIHETAHMDDFSWGVGTRNTSMRIGNDVKIHNEGYFEDRRPASNMDPYEVAPIILETFYDN